MPRPDECHGYIHIHRSARCAAQVPAPTAKLWRRPRMSDELLGVPTTTKLPEGALPRQASVVIGFPTRCWAQSDTPVRLRSHHPMTMTMTTLIEDVSNKC